MPRWPVHVCSSVPVGFGQPSPGRLRIISGQGWARSAKESGRSRCVLVGTISKVAGFGVLPVKPPLLANRTVQEKFVGTSVRTQDAGPYSILDSPRLSGCL